MEKSVVRFFVCAALVFPLAAQAPQALTNSSQHYRFSIPRTWISWGIDGTGILSAATYGKDQALNGGVTPAGQAVLEVIPQKTATSLDEWMHEKSKYLDQVRRKKITFKDSEPHADVSSYVQVEGRDEVGPGSYYREVQNYFTLKNHGLVMNLEFKEGDPREADYRAVLASAIQTFASLPSTR